MLRPQRERGEWSFVRFGLPMQIALPQQTRLPNSAMPQLCAPPAAMAEKRAPGGGVARSAAFQPQQTASPSAFRAQAWRLPADSAEKTPAGAQASQKRGCSP